MRLFKAVLMAALITIGAAAQAHNYHMGLTDISFNPRTGSTEIVHTYTAHDVEALLMNLYQRNFDLGLEEDQAVFRRYLEKQFSITANGKRLPIQWVGMEAKADSIVVYQEIEKTQLPHGATLRDGVLSDFLPSQVNTGKMVGETLLFTAQKNEQLLP
ncbi:MAG TPA: DUF6702 family protein [Pseudoduganella sp.]